MTYLDLEKAVISFAVPLRLGDGLDRDLLEQLLSVLDELTLQLRNTNSISKQMGRILFDAPDAIQSCEGLYSDSAMREGITNAAERVREKVREILGPANWKADA